MIDQTDERVVHAMKTLHPDKYENLLTDNGSQFSSKNYRIEHCGNSITAVTFGLQFIINRLGIKM